MQRVLRTLAISLVAIALSAALIVAGSYALFSDTVTVNTHLQAGTLQAKLERTYWSTTVLNADGYLKTEYKDESSNPKDYSGETNASIFEYIDGKIVPQSTFTATMQLTNGGDVAFGYWLEIVVTEGADTAFAEQLTVSVETVDGTVTQNLTQGKLIGSESEPLEAVKTGDVQTFTVTMTFIDDDTLNNLAQGQTVKFDLIVHAVQLTQA